MSKPIASTSASIERIDAWLPQTQCTRCGYPRCRAYAEAVVRGDADINQCPPGGEVTLHALARLLHTEVKPLDPRFGQHQPRARAVIDEKLCIGCRKCLDVCPVDAILGARKWMHTVIGSECTGCELCLPPCPVDCIVMQPVAIAANGPWLEYTRAETEHWRRRTEQRLERLMHPARERRSKTANKISLSTETYPSFPKDKEKIRADIRAAVERSKKKKNRQK